MNAIHRRQFIKRFGISTVSLPFLVGLPSLGLASPTRPRQRLVIMFSPNGTIPPSFWPDEVGTDFRLKEILQQLQPLHDKFCKRHKRSNKESNDDDGHMRG